MKRILKKLSIDLQQIQFINPEKLASEILEVINFLKVKQQQYKQTDHTKRPIWFRVNVIDQAVNDYLGIGFLNTDAGWLNFIVYSLSMDRADQSGDGIFVIIDADFNWAVKFELSQDFNTLSIQKIEN